MEINILVLTLIFNLSIIIHPSFSQIGCIFGDEEDCYLPCNCVQCNMTTGCISGCSTYLASSNYWKTPSCLKGNIALGKTAVQSENYNQQSNGALKAIDGRNDQVQYCAYAGNNTMAWWMVDLGMTHVIQWVTLYSFRTWQNYISTYLELQEFKVTFGNSSDIADHYVCSTYNSVISPGSYATISCSLVARYVAISKINGSLYQNVLPVCEVEVYGYPILDIECSRCAENIGDHCGNNGIWCPKCKAGWRAPDCKRQCLDTFYGENCAETCNCLNNATCDRVTGKCPGECQLWFVSPQVPCDKYIELINNPRPPFIQTITSHYKVSVGVYMEQLPSYLTAYYKYYIEYDTSPVFNNMKQKIVAHSTVNHQTVELNNLAESHLYYIRVRIARVHHSSLELGNPSSTSSFHTLCQKNGYYGDSCNINCHCKSGDRCNFDTGKCPDGCELWLTNVKIDGPCNTEIAKINYPNQVKLLRREYNKIHLNVFKEYRIPSTLLNFYDIDLKYSVCNSNNQFDPISASMVPIAKFTAQELQYNITLKHLDMFTNYCIQSKLRRYSNGESETGTAIELTYRTRCLPPPQPKFTHNIWPKNSVYIHWGDIIKSGSGCSKAVLTFGTVSYREVTKYSNGTWTLQTAVLSNNGTVIIHLKENGIYQFKLVVWNNDGLSTESEVVEIVVTESSSNREVTLIVFLVLFVLAFAAVISVALFMWFRQRDGKPLSCIICKTIDKPQSTNAAASDCINEAGPSSQHYTSLVSSAVAAKDDTPKNVKKEKTAIDHTNVIYENTKNVVCDTQEEEQGYEITLFNQSNKAIKNSTEDDTKPNKQEKPTPKPKPNIGINGNKVSSANSPVSKSEAKNGLPSVHYENVSFSN